MSAYFVPPYRTEALSDAFLLIDCEKAHWVCVNKSGYNLLEKLQTDRAPVLTSPQERFLQSCLRHGFIANQQAPKEELLSREELLGIGSLHEMWLVTNYSCNRRCQHCYTIDQVTGKSREQLPLSTLMGIVDEAIALGTQVFYITGGEPYMRPDIEELIAYVASRRKLILFTNGTMITPKRAAFLAQFRERLVVQVSMEGSCEATNAQIRGAGDFELVLTGIKHLLHNRVRVGISSTPTAATYQDIPKLTQLLCDLKEGGHQVEYHHIILLLQQGNAKKLSGFSNDDYYQLLERCSSVAHQAHKSGSRLKIVNEKILKACATNGPRKDFCGSCFTILAVDPAGNLKTCAATINDDRFNLGRLTDEKGALLPGQIQSLWQEGERARAIRRLSIRRQSGENPLDLRYFYGGGCWYNMSDVQGSLSTSHSFYAAHEELMLKYIKEAASSDIDSDDLADNKPRLLSYQHRSRVACAGGRKTIDHSQTGLDNGYCICFA